MLFRSPPDYYLPASKDGEPVVLVVGGATFPVYLDGDRGSMRVPAPSYDVARSIVEDYVTSHLGYEQHIAMPGMFFVPDAYTVDEVKKKFADRLKEAKRLQTEWFVRLVKIADDEWNRTHRHGAISDMQRVACKALGFTREWLMVPNPEEIQKPNVCPGCGTVINGNPMICAGCKFVLDRKRYDENKANFAA